MEECEIVLADAELELSHGLDERCRLDVTDRAAELFAGKSWSTFLLLSRIERRRSPR
jgi:hypothetical protein